MRNNWAISFEFTAAKKKKSDKVHPVLLLKWHLYQTFQSQEKLGIHIANLSES